MILPIRLFINYCAIHENEASDIWNIKNGRRGTKILENYIDIQA